MRYIAGVVNLSLLCLFFWSGMMQDANAAVHSWNQSSVFEIVWQNVPIFFVGLILIGLNFAFIWHIKNVKAGEQFAPIHFLTRSFSLKYSGMYANIFLTNWIILSFGLGLLSRALAQDIHNIYGGSIWSIMALTSIWSNAQLLKKNPQLFQSK